MMFRSLPRSFLARAKNANTIAQSRSFARSHALRSSSSSATEQHASAQTQPEKQTRSDFASPPFIRLHETLPSSLREQVSEDDKDFDVLVTIPSNFERSVGSERGELLDPGVWDDLLPLVVDLKTGVGSSALNPIIIPSLGLEERIVGCPGECYNPDSVDLDSTEWQYWVMKEDNFGMCDECGLVFFLASPQVIAQMELWNQLEDEWKEEEGISNQETEIKLDHSQTFEEIVAESANLRREQEHVAKQIKQ